MKNDALLKIVETQLQETKYMREKTSDFINRVVQLYTLQLMGQGNIPLDYMEEVLADVEAEAIEMYRKKTYGFLTLEEYRRHKFRQADDN
ncbi:DNA-dependent DNA polymerase [Bdellovibrio sp. HCB185ZH]|uniref:DNA-dependent DNA polymerase n=1 Tax=Bdellovibrio TaxID=958 RepID=UPI001157062F|nr:MULTISPECIES: DNA-dependent DNA polymerase [unclassified Bdellovibrio]QDK46416.1 DNA-dependent DNA polymerase [Bdellovibrio sp. ZAP7]QLY24595.1 DNA-dependent DNA polymerase [Bdellovibrio sp. KM01]